MPVVLNQIKAIERMLSPVDKRISDMIKERPAQFAEGTGKEIAAQLGVSESALIRYSKRIGFSGLKELKMMIAKELYLIESDRPARVESARSSHMIKANLFNYARTALKRTEDIIDIEVLEAAVQQIHQSGKILIFSPGETIVLATDFKLKLLQLDYKAEVTQDLILFTRLYPFFSTIFIMSEASSKKEVDFIIRNNSDEKKTIQLGNPLHKKVDYQLLTSYEENNGNKLRTVERIIQLAVIDIIYILLCQLSE